MSSLHDPSVKQINSEDPISVKPISQLKVRSVDVPFVVCIFDPFSGVVISAHFSVESEKKTDEYV